MQDLFDRKSFWVVVTLLVLAVNNYIVITRATDNAVMKMEKPYSPSPYGPGYDPDRVHESHFQKPVQKTSH